MLASPRRSIRAIVSGLAVLAVVSVGCAAEPADDDGTAAPPSAPDTHEVEGGPSGDTNAAAAGGTPSSAPDTPPAAVEPAAEPTAAPAAQPVTKPAPEPAAEPAAKPASKPAAEPAAKPAARPAAKPVVKPAVIADGSHAGRLVSITEAHITVELVRVLTGDEAIEAAKADGGAGLDEDGTLPNDVYIQDLDRVVVIPVAGDGGFRVYDCSGGCEIVGTTLTALASGEVVPYGGPNAVVNLTVDQGVVVSFEEQYLP